MEFILKKVLTNLFRYVYKWLRFLYKFVHNPVDPPNLFQVNFYVYRLHSNRATTLYLNYATDILKEWNLIFSLYTNDNNDLGLISQYIFYRLHLVLFFSYWCTLSASKLIPALAYFRIVPWIMIGILLLLFLFVKVLFFVLSSLLFYSLLLSPFNGFICTRSYN